MGVHETNFAAEEGNNGASPSGAKSSSDRDVAERSGHRRCSLAARNVQLLLLFGCRLVQTTMRMAMGPLVVYICRDMPCESGTKAWLLSAHAFGYCTTQVIGGYFADKAGGKAIIAASMALAGVALVVTPLAQSTAHIAASQFVMGVAMGPLFPASIQLMSRWLPPAERAFASTVLDTGITVGSLMAVPMSAALAHSFGWRMAYFFYGLAAIGFAVLFQLLAAAGPGSCSYCSEDERRFLAAAVALKTATPAGTPTKNFGLLLAVRHVCLWAIYLAHFVFNYGIYFLNSWSAIYYDEVFHLRPEDASFYLALPHAANMVAKVYGAQAIEKVLRRHNFSDLGCRRTLSGLGFILPSVFLCLIPLTHSPLVATCLFCLVFTFYGLHPSGFKANYMDVTSHNGGVVSGIGNTVSSTASSMGPLLVAHLRDSFGSWTPAFHSVVLFNVIAAAVFCTLSQARPVELVEEEWQQETVLNKPKKAPRLLQRLVRIVPLHRDRAD